MTQSTSGEIDSANNVSHNGEAPANHQALMVREYDMHGLSPYVAPGFGGNYVDAAPAGLNFSQLLHAIRRRWLLALIVGLMIGMPLAALLWLVAPENYEVVAWLHVGDPQSGNIDAPGRRDAQEYEYYRQTQAQRIRSPLVLEDALNKEGIASLPMLRSEKEPRQFLVDEITVVTPRDSELLQIKMSGKDPQQLVKIVNAVKDSYISNVVDVENRASVDKLNLLITTLTELQNDIANKRESLQKLQERTNSQDLDSVKFQYNMLIQKSVSIMGEMTRVRENLAKVVKQLAYIQNENDRGSNIPEYKIELALSHDDQIAEWTKQASGLQAAIDYSTNTLRQGDRDPQMKEYRKQLASIQSRSEDRRRELRPQILKQLKMDQRSEDGQQVDPDNLAIEKKHLTDELDGLQKELDNVAAETTKLGSASQQLEGLQQEIKEKEAERAKLQGETNNIRLALKLPSRVGVLNDASVPEAPSAVFRIVMTIFAGVLGLFLGSGTVVAMEYQAHRLSTSGELGTQTGLRILGTVPNLERLSRAKGLNGSAALQGILAESVDSIRTMLLRQSREEAPHVLVVTSAGDREGKTTVASHLAASLARSGRRALLIDGDLRAPTVHAMFSATLDPGLCEILRGEVDLEGAIQPTPVDGLMLVAAGACDYQAIASLSKDALKDLFAKAREQFEFIVIDAAPVLTYADTLLMAAHADAAILSVRRDVSQLQKVYEARERMESVGIKILGAVVNGITETSRRPAYALPSA